VEISTQVPLIESERSQQASTIDQVTIRNLPINRRDYLPSRCWRPESPIPRLRLTPTASA